MYTYGHLHMAKQKQDNQLELTYSSYVRTQDVTLKTCQRRWIIGRSGERGSGISVLAARHDDICTCTTVCVRVVFSGQLTRSGSGWTLHTIEGKLKVSTQVFTNLMKTINNTTIFFLYFHYPVGWGCRIHWLLLCSGVTPLQRSIPLWHKAIWWWGSSNAGALVNVEYPFIAIAPRSTLVRSGSTW